MTLRSQPPATLVTSRDNSLLGMLRQLARQPAAYRKRGCYWVEGEHLCQAALTRNLLPSVAVLSESFAATASAGWAKSVARTVLLPDALFDEISGLESPLGVGFLIDLAPAQVPRSGVASVVLDRVQDAGNAGSILRSAAAFGFRQVLSLKGSAAIWSPKVLRAGMGAHFSLELVEGLEPSAVVALGVPLVVTSSHQGALLHQQSLPWPCSWAFGNEGQGVGVELQAAADLTLRIGQPGGEESLNVAAAAAICLHASSISGRDRIDDTTSATGRRL